MLSSSAIFVLMIGLLLILSGGLAILMAMYLFTSSLEENSQGTRVKIRKLYVKRPYVLMVVVFLLPFLGLFIMFNGLLFFSTEVSVSSYDAYSTLVLGIIVYILTGICNIRQMYSKRVQETDRQSRGASQDDSVTETPDG